MARKGSQKVRTGCRTCKSRRVKCDETKPHCLRCTNHGRSCQGYPSQDTVNYSWGELLQKRPIMPALTHRTPSADRRALDFYFRVVAPILTEYSDDSFWIQLVAPATEQDAAVRHAVIAISSLYEHSSLERDTAQLDKTLENHFAISHYNHALREISKTADENTVLFVCILFVCIEVLNNNKDAAVAHSRHGVRIFNGSRSRSSLWVRERLMSMFVRLSIFPTLFDQKSLVFPPFVDAESDLGGTPTNLDTYRSSIDAIMTRCLRLLRTLGPRHGLPLWPDDWPLPDGVAASQQTLSSLLTTWQNNFSVFELAHPPLHHKTQVLYLIMRMKCLVGHIWMGTCTERNETSYDRYLAVFRNIVDLAAQAVVLESGRDRAPQALAKPKFVFDLGYLPILNFVALKCRDLGTRVAALDCMAILPAAREFLWDSALEICIAWRVVEKEHGADRRTLETRRDRAPRDIPIFPPPDRPRIKSARAGDTAELRANHSGERVAHYAVTFFTKVVGQYGLKTEEEWIDVCASPPHELWKPVRKTTAPSRV
ncbi:hypothetical protein B0T26DRAFT_641870 [Lasiosphaeria miniovina]|uniref:Zn(2)-C6 fungal-type domain-containing protein n=1 Tax=Lasiosphaeria miniovina TaxID=1954250 RepID=A0AA40AUG1_9PEZI|nr:uncharacterized protein B0T26DRAFT_641870 [Lasiosphaeria miniovina]KAK0722157.1 hypothetical protein B0T26DRAFT_641870 [Lasiosphaeria miniovina]